MEDLYNSSAPLQQSSMAPQTGGRKSNSSMVLMIVMIVLLLGAIGFGVWQWYEATKKDTEITNLKASNADLQAQVTNLEMQTVTTADGTAAPTTTDEILATVAAYTHTPVAAATKAFAYSVTANQGGFAKVKVEVQGEPTYDLILKKIDDVWTVVISSADTPTQQELDVYGIPASIYQP